MAKKATSHSRKAVTVKKKGGVKAAKETVEELPTFDVAQHIIVPKHEKLSDKEVKELFERYHAGIFEFPKISINDPAIQSLGVKQGDVIKVTRPSQTAKETIFYRGVIDE